MPDFKRLSTVITGAVNKMLDNSSSSARSNQHNNANATGGFNFSSENAANMLDSYSLKPSPSQRNIFKQSKQQRGLKKLVLAEKVNQFTGSIPNPFSDKQNSYFAPPKDLAERVTPYIELRARLSQIWINQHTIFLVLIIIKLVLFNVSLTSSLESTEKYTMSSCKAAENIGSSAASTPHYLALGANSMIDMSLTSARNGLIQALMLTLTILEQLLLFVIEMLVGTYTCLLTVAIDTTANSAINATEAVIHYVDGALSTVVNGLEDGVEAIEKVFNTVASTFNSISSAFNENQNSNLISNVSLSIGSLKNLSIPTSINANLEELRNHIPNYTDVKNATGQVISIPFDMLKTEINETLLSKAVPFNTSAIAIPTAQTITFCSNGSGIEKFYAEVNQGIAVMCKIFIIILSLAAVCACIPVAYHEIKEWRWIKHCAENVTEIYDLKVEKEQSEPIPHLTPTSNQRVDNVEIIQSASHKLITRLQIFSANRFSNLTQKALAKWWVEYVLYPPALMVLALGSCGLLVCVVQFIIFSQVKASLPAFEQGMGNVAVSVLGDVQDGIGKWANSTNDQILNVQNDINDSLLGWVHTATGSINDTIGEFESQMNHALNSTFGGTPFYQGITGVVYCVIGSKIDAIQKGIEWVHNNTQVSFPMVQSNYILPSALSNDTSESAAISSASANDSTVDSLVDSAVSLMTSALKALIEAYEKSLYLELKISLVLLSVWLFVALTGFLYCYITYRQVRKSVPNAKNFVHKKGDSLDSVASNEYAESLWGNDLKAEKSEGFGGDASLSGSPMKWVKDKVSRVAMPFSRPVAGSGPRTLFNAANNSSFGNLSIDKEWHKYRRQPPPPPPVFSGSPGPSSSSSSSAWKTKPATSAAGAGADPNLYTHYTNSPVTPMFRPPTVLLDSKTPQEVPCYSSPPPGHPPFVTNVKTDLGDDFLAEEDGYEPPHTPTSQITVPLPVYRSPCKNLAQKPVVGQSLDRKSHHAVNGFLHN